ncbi:glutathione S-transferase family protein [Niveispirillum fermenti]
MAIYAKGEALERQVELVPPRGPLNMPDFKAEFRFGRVPTLWLEDGFILQESEAIMDYFDDLQPDPPLKPDTILDRARMRMLIRLTDGSVLNHLSILFRSRNPLTRDQAAVDAALLGLADGYDRLEYHMPGGDYAIAGRLTLADCTLVPTIWLTLDFLPFFDAPSVLLTRPKLARYWQAVQRDPIVARIVSEMSIHLRAARAARIAAEAAEQAQSANMLSR